MKVAGIVVEFNPLTKGHLYLINKIRENYNVDYIVVAMSPNFVMRGEPAIYDKFTRCEMALKAGIDLVVEIPTVYAIQSADIYAKRGIELLNAVGVTDLFFGAECDELNKLKKVSEIMNSKEYNEFLKKCQDEGNSFNTSSKKAILSIDESLDSVINSPNNLLGIEYIKAVGKINPNINIHPIKRIETEYYDGIDENKVIQSATALREELMKDSPNYDYFPFNPLNLIKHVKNDYLPFIKSKIYSSTSSELKDILGMNEGFENKLRTIKNFNDYDELVNSLVSKRDRETKVNRILISTLLNIKKEESVDAPLSYVRILGFNRKGKSYLKVINKNNYLFINSIKRDLPIEVYRELDFTKMYSLPYKENILIKEYEPVIIEE